MSVDQHEQEHKAVPYSEFSELQLVTKWMDQRVEPLAELKKYFVINPGSCICTSYVHEVDIIVFWAVLKARREYAGVKVEESIKPLALGKYNVSM